MKIPVHLLITGIFLLLAGCSSDSKQLKMSRDAFIREDYSQAEAALYTQEVFKETGNRFVHYSSLASIAMGAGQYEKAIYFLLKGRDLVNSLRSSHAGFSFFSNNYASNGIEYSYIHYYLVMAHLLLAAEGKTPAWGTPEIKDSDGNILIAAQGFPAKEFTAREIADLRRKAHAELLAWDTHLENLKNSSTNLHLYHNDLWARTLASYVHSLSDQNSEKRTAELLSEDALRILGADLQNYPARKTNEEETKRFIQKLKHREKNQSLFVLEAGIMSRFKIKRFQLGLSTLFKGMNPMLRAEMEQIGFRVILAYAPEFGLTMLAGGLAGAASSNDEDSDFDGPPRFFSDAVDAGLGFQIQFPTLEMPPSDTKVTLSLTQKDKPATTVSLPVVSPLQEIMATDLKNREEQEMFKEAVTIGLQYLAILIPAIKAYQAADKEGAFFKKLMIVGGYYLAKKLIDNAHRPEIRSWSYLPKIIAADVLTVPAGKYQAKITLDNASGKDERDLGEIQLGDSLHALVRKRIGEVSILKKRPSFETMRP